jgi:4-amino-4-deoxy-L-arabinose transferase-like glycosyltransferase
MRELKGIHIFALIFTAIFLLHLPLLRLPYYWDEAGYYIPAAYDFFTSGTLIPHSVPSNGHPPLPAIYLALWWKLSAFKPAVTRVAMLLTAALGLTAVFRLARWLTDASVGMATVVCVGLFPVWFAQSSLAHADLPAAALVLWGLFFYFRSLLGAGYRYAAAASEIDDELPADFLHSRRDLGISVALFSLAALSKETAVIFAFALAAYDLVDGFRQRYNVWVLLRAVLLTLSALPIALWFIYHHHQTGFFFGNPEFFSYNVTGTLTPLRIALSLAARLWHMFGYMNLWLLTLMTVWVMRYPPLDDGTGVLRRRIPLALQFRIGAILLANLICFSLLGGAVLARYLLPMYPLVILIGIATLRRRLQEWKWMVALILAAFVLALFTNPFGYIPPEDNLSYRNYVLLHKEAADYLENRHPKAHVLTAWTATDELTKPFLGYVREPMSVVRVEDFSYSQLQMASMGPSAYDVALVFSTKQEPTTSLLDRWPWWERMSRKYFGFHRDLPPEAAAVVLGGRVTWQRARGQQWIAIISFDRIENAGLTENWWRGGE